MSSKIKVDTIENVAGSGNVSLGSGHNLVVPGDLAVDTNVLKVDSSNNRVGINTTSPSDDFELTPSADGKGITLKTTGNIRPYLNLESNRSGAGNNLSQINFKWNGTDVARIIGVAGSDTTNKDDGHITFSTASAGSPTEAMRVDSNGRVTKPLQPSFFVGKSGNQNNIGVSSYDTITFDTEVFDIGSNFASNTFTAPVTGKYHLTLNVRLDNVDTAAAYYNIGINTSNRNHYQLFQPNHPSDVAYYVQTMTVIADMDANDTASCSVNQQYGTSQTDVNVSTIFCGILIG